MSAWREVVVICLKNRTFAVSQTSEIYEREAWRSCDLLEKSYFCSITNIIHHYHNVSKNVVICLKNRTFAVSQTSQFAWQVVPILLWFAWKIVLLQYHKHPKQPNPHRKHRCDLLEKSYFCSITNIPATLKWYNGYVVICLKNRTFAVSQTSVVCDHVPQRELWFAWKIVLLQYHKHPSLRKARQENGCDLLEKSYFCSITNIKAYIRICPSFVVICLKNRTFAVSQTSILYVPSLACVLWFAWKIVLLQYHKHPARQFQFGHQRCDLLEKSYFCSITNIPAKAKSLVGIVVICLKNRTFAVSQTSVHWKYYLTMWLWFAWKIVLLQYHKHQSTVSRLCLGSCDLLEKSYFCSITNIQNSDVLFPIDVVICLKNRTFAVSQTSRRTYTINVQLLWFAWKIVLLQYHKHLRGGRTTTAGSCDLLEKSYFCSITNISIRRAFALIVLWFAWKIVLLQYHKHQLALCLRQMERCDLLEKSYFCSITNIPRLDYAAYHYVVICLKNRTFAVSQTSKRCDDTSGLWLWFAWKIVLLQYHKHREFEDNHCYLSCDLLEKSYFCSITNIGIYYKSLGHLLWFAWKIVLLQYHKHLLIHS